MPDILDQVGLTDPRGPSHLAVTPQSSMSASALVAPMKAIADAVGYDGAKLDEMTAGQQEEAGKKAAIELGPNGDVSSRLIPFASGPGQLAFNAALKQGAYAAGSNQAYREVSKIVADNPANPAGVMAAGTAYVDKLRTTGDPTIGPMVAAEADKLLAQGFAHATRTAATNAATSAQADLTERADRYTNNLYAIARTGGLDSAAGRDAAQHVRDTLDALSSNPAFGVSKDQIAGQFKHILEVAHGEAAVGTTDQAFAVGGAPAVETIKRGILDSTTSELSDAERQRLAGTIDARLAYAKGQRREDIAVAGATTQAFLDQWNTNQVVDPVRLQQHYARLTTLGAHEQIAALTARQLTAPITGPQAGATDAQRASARMAGAITASAPPQVISALQTATSKYGASAADVGLDEGRLGGLLNRIVNVESRFNPNAENATSGAAGLGQFIPSTWRQYGGGADPKDPAANADATARLLLDNARSLKAALGRNPTDGEIYLAHQQGAGGAAQLLKKPEARAIDIVGSRAVLGNGGTEAMTAGQFAQLWVGKFDKGPGVNVVPGGSYSAPPARGGAPASYPFTPQQDAANPYLYPAYVRQVLADREGQIKAGGLMADAIRTGVDTHDPLQLPSADNLGLLHELASRTGDPGLTKKVGDIETSLAGYDLWRRSQGQGGGEGAALVASAKAAAARGDLTAQAVVRAHSAWESSGVSRMNSDWITESVGRGWAPGPPPTLDMSNPQTIAQSVAGFGRVMQGYVAQTGDGTKGLFPPNALAQVKNVATNGSLDQRLALLQGMGGLPDATRNAAFGQLGQSAEGAAFAVAGSLANVDPGVASAIVTGQRAAQAEPRYLPSTGKNRTTFLENKDKGLPVSAFPPSMRGDPAGPVAALGAAIDAVYAARSSQAGDTSGVVNETRLKQAAADVTGGVVYLNGSPVIAPTRGMDQRTFDGVMAGLTDQDLAGVTTGNGRSIPADYVRSSARLHVVADGQFLVQLNASTDAPAYAAKGGQPFVLDLRNRRPAPVPPAPDLFGAGLPFQ